MKRKNMALLIGVIILLIMIEISLIYTIAVLSQINQDVRYEDMCANCTRENEVNDTTISTDITTKSTTAIITSPFTRMPANNFTVIQPTTQEYIRSTTELTSSETLSSNSTSTDARKTINTTKSTQITITTTLSTTSMTFVTSVTKSTNTTAASETTVTEKSPTISSMTSTFPTIASSTESSTVLSTMMTPVITPSVIDPLPTKESTLLSTTVTPVIPTSRPSSTESSTVFSTAVTPMISSPRPSSTKSSTVHSTTVISVPPSPRPPPTEESSTIVSTTLVPPPTVFFPTSTPLTSFSTGDTKVTSDITSSVTTTDYSTNITETTSVNVNTTELATSTTVNKMHCIRIIEPNFDYILRNNESGKACILTNMTIQINVQYAMIDFQINKSTLTVPKNAKITGGCGKKKNEMTLSWKEFVKNQVSNDDKENRITFRYAHKGSNSFLDFISIDIHLDSDNFPHAEQNRMGGDTTDRHLQLFSTSVKDGIFTCEISIAINVGNHINVVISNIRLIAFNDCINNCSRIENNCKASVNIGEIGAIIVGIILILTLVISYLIFKLAREKEQSHKN